MASLLALTGLRISEPLGADIENLEYNSGHRTLFIHRKGHKTAMPHLGSLDRHATYIVATSVAGLAAEQYERRSSYRICPTHLCRVCPTRASMCTGQSSSAASSRPLSIPCMSWW